MSDDAHDRRLGCGCERCGPPAPLPSNQIVDPHDPMALAAFTAQEAAKREASDARFAETAGNRPGYWGGGMTVPSRGE
jgi:hypothetical protein